MGDHIWNPHRGLVDGWMKEYASDQSSRMRSKDAIKSALKARLDDDGLNYHAIDCRVKDSSSLESKLLKPRPDGTPKYPDGLDQINDVIGVRVITYLSADVQRTLKSLEGSYEVIERVDKTAEQKLKGEFGYSGQHLVLKVPSDRPPAGCRGFEGLRFEVQVRTILQHAWAEFEHDVRYKGDVASSPEINRAFTLASGLIELADNEFNEIHKIVQSREEPSNASSDTSSTAAPMSGEDIQILLEKVLPTHPRSRADHYEWLKDVFDLNGVTDVASASKILTSVDWSFIAEKIQYKMMPGHVRAADDLLLHHFGEDYIEKTEELGDDAGREGKLKYRLKRLKS